MPIAKSYLDHFYVRNISRSTVTLGDLVNLAIEPGQKIDILTIPRVDKEKINQSHALQEAIRQGRLRIEKEKCRRKKKSKAEREATLSDEERELCDLSDVNLSGLQDDDLLQYNSNTGKWENQEPTEIDINLNVISISENYTVSIEDDLILCDASGGDLTITLPTATGNSGKQLFIKKIDNSNHLVIIDGYNAETIDGETTQSLTVQNDCVDLANNNTNWFIT